jgi:hypothetical protein
MIVMEGDGVGENAACTATKCFRVFDETDTDSLRQLRSLSRPERPL